MGLGDKCGDTDIDLAPTPVGAFDFSQIFHQIHQCFKIIIGFGGKTDHKIEFDHLPAQLKCILHRVDDFLFTDIFINHVTQALAAGFRGNCEAGFAHLLNQFHQFRCQRARPQGRQ